MVPWFKETLLDRKNSSGLDVAKEGIVKRVLDFHDSIKQLKTDGTKQSSVGSSHQS